MPQHSLHLHVSILFYDQFSATHNLIPVNNASCNKIDTGLYPKRTVFVSYFIQGGSCRIDSDKSLYSRCGRKQITDCFPERRYCLLRPGHAGDKQQNDRSKDKDQHRRLTACHKTGQGHRQKDGREQIRQNKQHNSPRLSHLRQLKYFRNHP